MKPGTSTLNPYAASYIPLSKREAVEVPQENTEEPRSGSETVGPKPPEQAAHSRHYGSSSQTPNVTADKEISDEEFDMDLGYLQMTFPGISDESLADIYLANKGDLEATVDMLSQLELYTAESSQNLPDSLDIGDIPESGSSAEGASLKLKNVASEASASSSGSRDPAVLS